MKDLNTPVWMLTVGELIDFIADYTKRERPEPELPVRCDHNVVHGISGIAKLLGCSKVMVHEYRRQGWIEPAIKQYGRKIICDARMALELFGKRKDH
ncbi:MAG: DUF3853 family protein [Prevotellaceae bacterium]|jgi:hypothetical protein|nr:DUF3853 family protein [Prevotellaceae bacterium]